QRHSNLEAEQADGSRMPACFAAPDTVDAWRHRRMHEMLNPLIEAKPDATWLTVGDGSYGSDAFFLQQKGVDVLASSLTDSSLKIAAEQGYLKKYAAVNAEQIPYGDASFDFVLCKEAYHHFPRPAIAFYEMLRVAKEAVVLIEPYDGPKRFLDMIKEPMKKLLWGKSQTIHFEPSGNFIYRINPKEMGKKLAAMGYAAVAYKTFNDIYLPMFGKSKVGVSVGHMATKLAILLQNILCALRLLNPGLVTLVCFKQMPPDALVRELTRTDFSFNTLPVNPYT
ncbi:MAG: class I SAM-dependent methyltransferase, partial [Kiritimatiellales bacterium]|nr:class I SAM-dependent methyltransferase [Kiritimatiellales bacterium]